MRENLYYLFISGLILGSGPCLSLCAPILISYTAIYKNTLKKSLYSYALFSVYKLIGYAIMGILGALSVGILNNPIFRDYLGYIYLLLAMFIVVLGVTIVIDQNPRKNSFCNWLHRGNIRNIGVLGLLVGLSPCLPLLGILNYIIITSSSPLEAVLFTLVFGVGTILSPLILAVVLSARLGKWFSENEKFKRVLKIICGLVLVLLGSKIILQRLLP